MLILWRETYPCKNSGVVEPGVLLFESDLHRKVWVLSIGMGVVVNL